MYTKYAELRDERGISDYEVSKLTGIPKSTFSDWKSGRSCPKADKLLALAALFNVPLETFIKQRDVAQ